MNSPRARPDPDRWLPNLLTRPALIVDKEIVSANLVAFVLPKDWPLASPRRNAGITQTREGFQVTLTAAQPALRAWLSLDGRDARCSDNFVHVSPDARVQIVVQPEEPGISLAQFKRAVRSRSLFDTYTM